MSEWNTMKDCDNCHVKSVIKHDEKDSYPEYCPFCGLDKYGAAAEQVFWPEEKGK